MMYKMNRYDTLTALLQDRKSLSGAGITFIEPNKSDTFFPYSELFSSASAALAFLQNKGIKPGDEVVLQIDDNRSFIVAFWACILGGIIPVPLAIGRNDDHKKKLFNVWPYMNNPYLIISSENFQRMQDFSKQQQLEERYAVIGNKMIDEAGLFSGWQEGEIYNASENDIAFIQFSSGSTGNPKGVTLTHKNLITNIQAISKAAAYTIKDSMISWMPLTHDMGLIGFHINPLFIGMNQYLIPTGLFVRRPLLWPDKASQYRISILGSPNFGYEYLLKNADLASHQYNWNLDTVRLIYNGAEPIQEKLCRNFLNGLSIYGLKSHSMCPVYGLAEASLAVTISGMEDEVIALSLDRNKLNNGDHISITTAEDQVSFVNVGRPVTDCSLRIADEYDVEVPDEIIGHILIKGNNVTTGYYNNTAATEKIKTRDGWLKTGDLGFIKDHCLYITGRAKDIVFFNGQNYYAHDLERIAQEVEGIELNKVAISGFYNDSVQKEEIAAFVLHRGEIEAFVPLAQALKEHVSLKAGISIDRIIPVKDIHRTTSGKLQRFRLTERFKNGDFSDADLRLQQLMEQEKSRNLPETTSDDHNEQLLLKIWTYILKTSPTDVNQHFFEAGGNSLKAAEMSMEVWKNFQVDLPVETIYKKPTIRELAIEIKQLHIQEYIPIPVIPATTYYPLSSAQIRIYYSWEINRFSTAYNIPIALQLKGDINKARLEHCIQQLIDRHDALRIKLSKAHELHFSVADSFRFILDCNECSHDALDQQLRNLVMPFDLFNDQLFRSELLQTGRQEYILFFDFHHIIADGISIYHIIKELLDLYSGIELLPPPLQYKDYTTWEKVYLQSTMIGHQEAYWLSQLQGELPVLEMATDFQRPVVLDTSGAKLVFEPGKELVDKLSDLASANECTLHVLLFTIYNILLFKYTGQEDIITGIPVANRRHPDLHNTVGMFVNNLAIRSRPHGGQTFYQLLSAIKKNVAAALDNQDYPFMNLIQKAEGRRDVSRNPLFDTMFIYQNMGFPQTHFPDLSITPYPFDPGFSKFDISLEIFEGTDTHRFAFEYATSLFRKETIAAIANHFTILMNSVADHPHMQLADLPIISPSEYDEYTAPLKSDNPHKTIVRLFEEQALRTPDHIAITFNHEEINYHELNKRADHLAGILRQKGVARGSIIGIFLPASPGFIISVLAVLKAGGAYLPIEPDMPEERIKYLIRNSYCSLLIAETGSTDNLIDIDILHIDNIDYNERSAFENPQIERYDDAYVIYTSGTTGLPKGVVITHSSLSNYINWAVENYIKNEPSDFPLYTSVSFDLTITSIFAPLVTGNRIVIYQNASIDAVVADNKADIIKATPSHLKVLVNSKPAETLSGSRIKRIIVGGEQLETSLALNIYHKFNGKVQIYNEYGPTEATVGCMIHTFDPEETLDAVPIGIPATDVRIYILDRFLKPVPTGAHGEIYIGGACLARGYLYNEALTAERFIPDPFLQSGRMYKTGDIAKRLFNGVIAYIGRSDRQTKLNGYRIEPGEIEYALKSYPGITEALVNIKEGKNLYAYYTGSREIGEFTWRSYLAPRLPHYMMPTGFIRVEKIPLTINGKVDYDLLPVPSISNKKEKPEEPGNWLESVCLQIWEDILGIKELGITDNFLELGGDSIKAVQISSLLKEKGIIITVRDILTYQNVKTLCQYATIAQKNTSYEQEVIQGERGLVPAEAWFFSRNFENPNHYNQSVLLDLNKPFNIDLLQQSFKRLIRHHDGLRTNYDPGKRKMYYNNRHLEDEFIIGRDTSNSFDITNSLLMKAAIIKEDTPFGKLFITAHHLVIDGISWRILLEDLYNIYYALEKGEEPQLPMKTASMQRWEKALHEYSNSPAFKKEALHWNRMADYQFALPTDFDADDWRVENMQVVKGILDRENTDFLLKGAHRAYNTDVQILLITALTRTLMEWTGMEEFIIEQESHGRHLDMADTSRTTGWFTAMYPLQLKCPRSAVEEQVKAIKEQIRNPPAQAIGWGIRKYMLQPDSNMGDELTTLRFNYLGQFDRELNNDIFSYNTESDWSDTDVRNKMTARLEFNIAIIREQLILEIKYNRQEYLESTINRIRTTFLENIQFILDHISNAKELHFTPSDFQINLDQQELDALFK